jgi:threonine dehydratase
VSSSVDLRVPTLDDVHAASERIAPHLQPTPLLAHGALSELVGTEILVKHENHLPTGAFKVRGGINLVSQLGEDERRRGVVTASTGNHGQSIAFAGGRFGVRAIVCVPQGANPVKLAAMERLGAELVVHGRDFDEAREHCEALAEEHGYRYVHSGNEPELIAGVGTATVELLEARPDVEVVIVPIGGGSGAAGACVAGKGVKPGLEVIGVQSSAAPAAYRSWRSRRLLEDRMATRAEGLATRVAFELPQRILWEQLDEFVLVDEEELDRAVVQMLEGTRNLAEPAGAAPLAAALRLRERLAGKTVALIQSGGNISPAQLRELLEREE